MSKKSISQSMRDYKRAKAAERVRWADLLDQISDTVLEDALSLREAAALTGLHRKTITAAVDAKRVLGSLAD